MKTLIFGLLAASTLVPASANAQTRELARDRQEIREERRDLERAYRYGDRRDIREERRELRDARREYREDLRDFRAGQRLHRSYYTPRYYVARPWEYRLPRASGPYRWVRYGRDFLLVNVRNGYVRDVVRGRGGWR